MKLLLFLSRPTARVSSLAGEPTHETEKGLWETEGRNHLQNNCPTFCGCIVRIHLARKGSIFQWLASQTPQFCSIFPLSMTSGQGPFCYGYRLIAFWTRSTKPSSPFQLHTSFWAFKNYMMPCTCDFVGQVLLLPIRRVLYAETNLCIRICFPGCFSD